MTRLRRCDDLADPDLACRYDDEGTDDLVVGPFVEVRLGSAC